VGGLPLRRFRTKAKIEERKEKERIRRNRMEMMDAIIHETHEEDKYKKALRRKREKRISAEKEPNEALKEREQSIEKERIEKGTSLTSSQESNADKLEDELDNFERAEHQHAHDSALKEKGKEKVSDADEGNSKADHDEEHSTAVGGSGASHDRQGLSHAEERKQKKQKKKEDKMLKKELKAKEKLDRHRHHSVERTPSQVSITNTESRDVRNNGRTEIDRTATADTASVASEDKRRRLQRMLSRQQTKMKLWEEKEKDKWALLRKRLGAKQASQSDKYCSLPVCM
jgi:hypothetical protein